MNSQALALGLEEHQDMEQLTWGNPMVEMTASINPMGPSSHALTTISGSSMEEQQLVCLIEGMSEKVGPLRRNWRRLPLHHSLRVSEGQARTLAR